MGRFISTAMRKGAAWLLAGAMIAAAPNTFNAVPIARAALLQPEARVLEPGPAAIPPAASEPPQLAANSGLSNLGKARGGAFDVFGSVAVAIDSPWLRRKAVESGIADTSSLCEAVTEAACRPWDDVLLKVRDLPPLERIRAVNAAVNGGLVYRRDDDGDQWASARQTLIRGFGDCEDFALLKIRLLADAGVPLTDMALVVVAPASNPDEHHAVVIVRLDDRYLVLDIQLKDIMESDAVEGYRPLYSLNSDGAWLHGTASTAPASPTITTKNP